MSAMAAGGVGPAPIVSPSLTDLAVVVCVVMFLAVIERMFALVWRRYSRVTGTAGHPTGRLRNTWPRSTTCPMCRCCTTPRQPPTGDLRAGGCVR